MNETELPKLTNDIRAIFQDRVNAYLREHQPKLVARIEQWEDESWSMLLVCPKAEKLSEDSTVRVFEHLFSSFDMTDDDVFYDGYSDQRKGYVWVVSHPDTPKAVKDWLKAEEEAEEAAENEPEKFYLPVPDSRTSTSTSLYLVLANEYFQAIKTGEKTVEYRDLTDYYANKILGRKGKVETVLLQNGYGGKGHVPPEQLHFKVESVVYVDDKLEEFPCYRPNGDLTADEDLPNGFQPTMFGIKLGSRITNKIK